MQIVSLHLVREFVTPLERHGSGGMLKSVSAFPVIALLHDV